MDIFPIIAAYASAAFILFRLPNLFHKPVPPNELQNKHFLIMAHRGGSGENPEGTLKAFTSSSWVDILELDVVLSADKQIVVSHDDDLERICGVKALISKLKYEDLPPYQKEFPSQSLDGNFKSDEPGSFCLLEDIFKAFPNNIISVEMKSSSDEAIELTAKLIQKYERSRLTVKTNRFSGLTTQKPTKKLKT